MTKYVIMLLRLANRYIEHSLQEIKGKSKTNLGLIKYSNSQLLY